jgi:hypothetical protein
MKWNYESEKRFMSTCNVIIWFAIQAKESVAFPFKSDRHVTTISPHGNAV